MRRLMVVLAVAAFLVAAGVAYAGTTVVESITGSPGDWTYTYTLTNGETRGIWQWAVWFPSNPSADSVTAGTANWSATDLDKLGFFPEEYTAFWGCDVYDSSGNDLAGPNGEPGFYYTYASDYGSSNAGEYYTGAGYWDAGGSWLPLPDNEGAADATKVWRGTKDYGYPFDFWGWDGSGANITTSYPIAPGGVGTLTVHSATLVTGVKSFSLNTTDYCFSFYDPNDGSDNFDFELSGQVTPVSEPGALSLVGLGLVGLVRRRRRR